MRDRKVALIYDKLDVYGGGERVLEQRSRCTRTPMSACRWTT